MVLVAQRVAIIRTVTIERLTKFVFFCYRATLEIKLLLTVEIIVILSFSKKHVLELEGLIITRCVDRGIEFHFGVFLVYNFICFSFLAIILHFNILFKFFLFSLKFNSQLIKFQKSS